MRFSNRVGRGSRTTHPSGLSGSLNNTPLDSTILHAMGWRRQAGRQYWPPPALACLRCGCALEKCNQPPGQARGSQTSLHRSVILSKDKCYDTHHPVALTSEKPSLACLPVGIKTNSDPCALCVAHVIPSAWHTLPLFSHLVNAPSSSPAQLNITFLGKPSGTFSIGSNPQWGTPIAYVHHLITL